MSKRNSGTNMVLTTQINNSTDDVWGVVGVLSKSVPEKIGGGEQTCALLLLCVCAVCLRVVLRNVTAPPQTLGLSIVHRPSSTIHDLSHEFVVMSVLYGSNKNLSHLTLHTP
jgi:hypothetical protein